MKKIILLSFLFFSALSSINVFTQEALRKRNLSIEMIPLGVLELLDTLLDSQQLGEKHIELKKSIKQLIKNIKEKEPKNGNN